MCSTFFFFFFFLIFFKNGEIRGRFVSKLFGKWRLHNTTEATALSQQFAFLFSNRFYSLSRTPKHHFHSEKNSSLSLFSSIRWFLCPLIFIKKIYRILHGKQYGWAMLRSYELPTFAFKHHHTLPIRIRLTKQITNCPPPRKK